MIQEKTQMIRPAQVCQQLAISSTTLWRLVKANKITAPIKVSCRAVAFKASSIEKYLSDLEVSSNAS